MNGNGHGSSSGSRIDTRLTFLTLNAVSKRPNPQTFVDLDFTKSNEDHLTSTFVNFFCWGEFFLNDDLAITFDPGSTKLLVQSTHAMQNGTDVNVMGLVENVEHNTNTISVGTAAPLTLSITVDKEYTYPLFNNSTPLTTPTTFYPF